MIKNLIFDFDGVILDSFPDQYKWFSHISNHLGKPFDYSMQEFKEVYCEPVYPNMYEFLGLEWGRNKGVIWSEYNKHKANATIELVTGIVPVLDKLRNMGLEMAIASSNTKDAIGKQLDDHGLHGYFSIVTTKDDLSKNEKGEPNLKPHPECILIALGRMGKAPEDCVYIGDQVSDIEATRRIIDSNGKPMKVMAATYGYSTFEKLLKHGPDFIVTTPQAIVTTARMNFM
ncbi:MAG: HAD family hydrolase [Candidatus Woesearchaeota archaeon]